VSPSPGLPLLPPYLKLKPGLRFLFSAHIWLDPYIRQEEYGDIIRDPQLDALLVVHGESNVTNSGRSVDLV
jgi:hypothetical protein